MGKFIKKYRIPIIAVFSVIVVAAIITGALVLRKETVKTVNKENGTTTQENETSGADNSDEITTGEWIELFAQQFGLLSYENETPYFGNVDNKNTVFAYIQAMAENDILDTTDDEISLDKTISQKSAMIQIAKMYGDNYIGNRLKKDEITDEDYIRFATENIGLSLTATDKGFSIGQAQKEIEKAWEHYLSREYENIQEVEYTDNVVDLTIVKNYVYENNTILITTEEELSDGKIILLNQNDNGNIIAYKIVSAEKENNNYVLDVAEPELDDFVETMNLEFSEVIDMDNFIPAEGVTIVENETVSAKNIDKEGEFNVDKNGTFLTLELNLTKEDIKISPEWEEIHSKLNLSEISTKNLNYFKDTTGNISSKFTKGIELVGKVKLKDLTITGNVDYSLSKGLAFDVNTGITVEPSLSLKGKAKGKTFTLGSIPVSPKNPFATFAIDICMSIDIDGEITIKPEITVVSTAKKTYKSSVNYTGKATTDFNSEIKGSVKAEICPDVVLILFGNVQAVDMYIKTGVGADLEYPTDDGTKITLDVYAPTLKVGVGLTDKTILSALGIKGEVKIIDRKGAWYKCPFNVKYTYNILTNEFDVGIGEEGTEAPTEPVTEAPTEAPTQKPTEAPTEAPTQKPTEPQTEAPAQPALSQYELSSQTYDYAAKYGDNYYLVKLNGLYGVVDFYGNVKIPVQYESYEIVGTDEVEFISGVNSYVYNAGCSLVYQYVNKELITDKAAYECNCIYGEDFQPEYGHHGLYIESDGNSYVSRTYYSNMLIEIIRFNCMDTLEWEYKICNTKTNALILKERGLFNWSFLISAPGGGLYIPKGRYEEQIVLLSSSEFIDKLYVYTITSVGYKKTEVSITVFEEEFTGQVCVGSGYYSNGWIKYPWYGVGMLNIDTFEWLDLPYDVYYDYSEDDHDICRFYYGNGIWYGANTIEGGLYDLCKGSQIISSGYEWLSFDDEFISGEKNGIIQFIDYNTAQVVKEYKAASDFHNGKALVDDGTGLYYVDTSFNRISDYVYVGTYDDVTSEAIKINGRYHLIKQK